MLRLLLTILAGGLCLAFCAATPQQPDGLARSDAPRIGTMFRAYDIWVEAGDGAVAAWQVTLGELPGQLVGVEGGQPEAFRNAPRYDPRALHDPDAVSPKLILAALAKSGVDVPSGRFRVARVHLQMPLGPMPAVETLRAVGGDPTGARLEITVQCTPVEAPR